MYCNVFSNDARAIIGCKSASFQTARAVWGQPDRYFQEFREQYRADGEATGVRRRQAVE